MTDRDIRRDADKGVSRLIFADKHSVVGIQAISMVPGAHGVNVESHKAGAHVAICSKKDAENFKKAIDEAIRLGWFG